MNIVNNNITSEFISQEGNIIALAKGMNINNKIIMEVDPENWAVASGPKRWYILYHELGHDVLNFKHGEGGKMMFNFVDRDYTWDEFIKDKDYMFDSFFSNYKSKDCSSNKTNLSIAQKIEDSEISKYNVSTEDPKSLQCKKTILKLLKTKKN